MTQSTLKASAASWKPSGGGDSNQNKSAASGPSASAWGRKPSEAIRKAGPAPTQPSRSTSNQNYQKSKNNNSNNSGWRRGVKDDEKSNWSRGNRNHDGGGNNGGRGGRGRGGGRHNRNHHRDKNHYNHNDGGADGSGWTRGKSLPVELIKPGDGTTPVQKAVRRITVEELLSIRMSYVAPPLLWIENPELAPKDPAIWNSETRVAEIDAMHKAPRMAGDVSSNKGRRGNQKEKNETAPPLEECAPLKVNEETRWKASVFNKEKKDEDENIDTDEEVMKKALLILNKLSLTKFDKLSDAFIDTGIGRNEECLKQAISLVLSKAQSEPHFSNMYASLCLKLAKTPMEALGEEGKKKGKKFKKFLLERCQNEFEIDTAHKIANATENITDVEEKEYHANIIKKNYLGHMRFIGELYKGDLIRINIMLYCLYDLLDMSTDEFFSKDNDSPGEEEKSQKEDKIDEEKVECFAKLMTTIGGSLEQQSEAAKESGKPQYHRQLGECWKTVGGLAKDEKKGDKPRVSNRIKFMLQDLIEMRKKGWKTRRKEETAKTIEQIHKEVAKEERAARRSGSSSNLRKLGSMSSRNSSGDIRNLDRSKSSTDADGFTTVKSGINRSMSAISLRRSGSDGFQTWNSSSQSSRNDAGSQKSSKMKRSASGGAFSVLRQNSNNEGNGRKSNSEHRTISEQNKAAATPAVEKEKNEKTSPPKVYKDPVECGKSSVNVLKEFFVGGDADDAVLSIFELVGEASTEKSLERGIAVVESTCGHVLECKAQEVEKYISILLRCADESKLSSEMIKGGMLGLLEFLSDIAIDAPLATVYMAQIVGSLVKKGVLQLEFLLSAPEYFKTDGNSAHFAVKVMKEADALGGT